MLSLVNFVADIALNLARNSQSDREKTNIASCISLKDSIADYATTQWQQSGRSCKEEEMHLLLHCPTGGGIG